MKGDIISEHIVIVAEHGTTVPLPDGVDWQVERVEEGLFTGFRVTDPSGKEMPRLIRFVDPHEWEGEVHG